MTEKLGTLGLSWGRKRLGHTSEVCKRPWCSNFCDWLFHLSCLILITTFTSSWLLYQSPFVYWNPIYALYGSLNDNTFYYWLHLLFNLQSQEWNTIKSRTIIFRFVYYAIRYASVQFNCSVMSDYLQPHERQHTRPSRPSSTPGVYSNSRMKK